jgi:flagellar hook-associated protein 1
VPRQADEVRISPITHPGSNNGNALTFASLIDRAVVDGQVVGDAYASLFTAVGVRAQGAGLAADSSGAAATNAAAALSAQTGVNIDEEAARLIQYQQAYQAAAKVMQSAQAMIDTVLGLAR